MNKNPLSVELKVACEIYRFNIENKPVWFGRLAESFHDRTNKNLISRSIDTLFDWGILKAKYDEVNNRRLLLISKETIPLIKELYEKYWKERDNNNP